MWPPYLNNENMNPRTRTKLELTTYGNLGETSPTSLLRPPHMHESIEMKHHQQVLLEAMIRSEARERPINASGDMLIAKKGVVGDKVGSGKSLVVLGLIDLFPFLRPIDSLETTVDRDIFLVKKASSYDYIPINIITVPHSIVKQWHTYATTSVKLPGVCVISKRKDFVDKTPHDFSGLTLICSSTFFNDLATMFMGKTVSRVVFDEADTIPIRRCASISASFTWFISSSMHNLLFPGGTYAVPDDGGGFRRERTNGLTRNGFIRDTFQALECASADILRGIFLKNGDSFVDSSFHLPTPTTSLVRCRTPACLNIIIDAATDDVIRMINAGDMHGAADRLGLNSDTSEGIVDLVTLQLRRKLDNCVARKACIESSHYSSETEKRDRLARVQTEIAAVQTQLEEIRNRLVNTAEDEGCPVCYDTLKDGEKVATICCKRLFCLECMTRTLALRAACPICRTALDRTKIVFVTKQRASKKAKTEDLPDKNTALMDLIVGSPPDSTFLLFAEYDNTLTSVAYTMEEKSITHGRISGNSNQIASVVERFRQGEIRVLLLNSTYSGTGLNLETATDVVIYHRMSSKDMEMQVIGRAQRPGRTTPLRIHYLVHDKEDCVV